MLKLSTNNKSRFKTTEGLTDYFQMIFYSIVIIFVNIFYVSERIKEKKTFYNNDNLWKDLKVLTITFCVVQSKNYISL